MRPFAERLITLARREDDRLHARRLAARHVQDRKVVKKLFDDIGARFATRPGGLHPHHASRARARATAPRWPSWSSWATSSSPTKGKDDKGAAKKPAEKTAEKKADKAEKRPAKKKAAAKKAAPKAAAKKVKKAAKKKTTKKDAD